MAFHNYICADGLTPAGTAPGCTDTNVYNYVGGAASYNDASIVFPYTQNTTYYVTLTASAANGTNQRITFAGDVTNTNCNVTSTTMEEVPCAVGAIGTATGIIIRWDDAGTMQNICIDDDGVSCTGGSAAANNFSLLGVGT